MGTHALPIHSRITPSMNYANDFNNLCCCMSCFNLKFLQSPIGILKITQVAVASVCQSLLLNFGIKHATTIGFSFESFLSTVASCMMTSTILVICYVLSSKSFKLIRSSIFELLFNGMAACLYLGSSAYLWFAVNTFLYPYYLITPFYTVYPAMTAAYMFGFILGGLHLIDAYVSLKNYRGYF